MITVIKASNPYLKMTKIMKLVNEEGKNNCKEVLIIRPFEIEGLLELDNVVVVKPTDENIVSLIDIAEIIIIDEVGSMIEGIELVYLSNLGKDIYYTAQRLEENMPYDKIM